MTGFKKQQIHSGKNDFTGNELGNPLLSLEIHIYTQAVQATIR